MLQLLRPRVTLPTFYCLHEVTVTLLLMAWLCRRQMREICLDCAYDWLQRRPLGHAEADSHARRFLFLWATLQIPLSHVDTEKAGSYRHEAQTAQMRAERNSLSGQQPLALIFYRTELFSKCSPSVTGNKNALRTLYIYIFIHHER